jgi:hypothetical protein
MIGSSPLLAGLGSGETDMGCEKKSRGAFGAKGKILEL